MTYRTRAEIAASILDVHADSGDTADLAGLVEMAGGIDATDIIEAAQVVVDNQGGRTFVGAARVFGALFGIRDEDEAYAVAEALLEWDRER